MITDSTPPGANWVRRDADAIPVREAAKCSGLEMIMRRLLPVNLIVSPNFRAPPPFRSAGALDRAGQDWDGREAGLRPDAGAPVDARVPSTQSGLPCAPTVRRSTGGCHCQILDADYRAARGQSDPGPRTARDHDCCGQGEGEERALGNGGPRQRNLVECGPLR